MEQEEYTREGITWSYIEFVDNQDVLDMIEKTLKNHKRFRKPKLSRSDFTVFHYAGEVTYQADLFLDKNKDYVVADHQSLLGDSKCSFVAGLFPRLANSLKSSKFKNLDVLQQLRRGVSIILSHIIFQEFQQLVIDDFIDRFGILAPEVSEGNRDEKTATKKILDKMGLQGYQIGATKLFLRAGQMTDLDARRAEVLGNAEKGKLASKLYKCMKRENASVRIQKHVCRFQTTKAYSQLHLPAIVVQSGLRAMLLEMNTNLGSKLKLQPLFSTYTHYKKLKMAAIILQCIWRGRVGRRVLKLKMAVYYFDGCPYGSSLLFRRPYAHAPSSHDPPSSFHGPNHQCPCTQATLSGPDSPTGASYAPHELCEGPQAYATHTAYVAPTGSSQATTGALRPLQPPHTPNST
eukprot:Gb_33082 [translate_table: standard]